MVGEFDERRNIKQKVYPWLIVLGCCFMQIGGIGVFLDTCGVFYVPASQGLGITVGTYSSYLTFVFIGTAFAAIALSMLIDKVDIRLLIGVNVMVCALALSLMGYYPFMWCRWIAGFIVGFNGGFFFMTMTPILINNWFIKRKGLAMGIAMASSGVGAAILSPLVTYTIQQVGWRLSYVLVAILVVVLIMPFVLFVFRRKPEEIGLKPYGWKPESENLAEAEQPKSGIPAKHASRSVSFICVCCFVGCIAMFSPFNSHLNAFGQSIGFSAMVSSTFLTAVSIGSILEKFIMGWLYDYISIYKIIAINCVLLIIGLYLLSSQTSLWLLYLGATLFGVQNSLVAVQTPLLVRELFGDREYEKLLPFTRVGVGIFGLFGPTMITAILNNTGTYQYVWASGIIIVVIAATLVLVARRTRVRVASKWIEEKEPCAEKSMVNTPIS